jgi:hypothetical protein
LIDTPPPGQTPETDDADVPKRTTPWFALRAKVLKLRPEVRFAFALA